MAIFKKGENWFVDVKYGHGPDRGRYRKCVGNSLREAEKAEARIKAMIAAGDWSFMKPKPVSARLSAVTKRYLDEWSSKRKVKRSYDRDKAIFKVFKACVGDKYFDDITLKDVNKFVSQRQAKGLHNDTVNRELHTIKHLFTKAVEWEEIDQSVAHKVKPLPADPPRLRYLTKEEAIRLLEECRRSESKNLYPIVLTALFTGARRGEVFAMQWSQIDFSNRSIKIIGTKNKTIRVVPLVDEVCECLTKVPRHIQSEYVFFGKEGRKIGHIYTAFWKALERAEIEDFRFHDLRHTFASWLAMSGEDLIRIKDLLGHKSIAMTLRYAHLSPEKLDRSRDALTKFWRSGAIQEKKKKAKVG